MFKLSAQVYTMMRRMTGGNGKGWRDARQKVMEAGGDEILLGSL